MSQKRWLAEEELHYALDEEDEALIRHIMCDDDRPPQGLHQGGYKPFHPVPMEEEGWTFDYLYPPEEDEWTLEEW